MKILVMSDSHGNARNVSEAVKRCYDADMIIHLGDGFDEYESIIKPLPVKSVCVRGNCDRVSEYPKTTVVEVSGKRILCTHGHDYEVKYDMSKLYFACLEQKADIALFGHTHFSDARLENGIYFINPGSVGGVHISPSYAVVDISASGIMPNIVKL